MDGQIDIFDYLKQTQHNTTGGCGHCVCKSCLYWHSGRCPYGGCYDDQRSLEDPYYKAHPDRPPRTWWSNWRDDQAYWCRGGAFYPVSYCPRYTKYKGSTIKDCLKAATIIYQDGYIECSLVETYGCEACLKEFEDKQED